jgi:hypothetical protein
MSGSSSTIRVEQRVATVALFVVTAPFTFGAERRFANRGAGENRAVEVAFQLGPVSSHAARLWLRSGLDIVAALRVRPTAVPFHAERSLLDLIDMYFTLWSDAADAGDPFVWHMAVDSAIVETIALQWRWIAAMDDDHVAALGCTWPPAEALPFHEALLAAVIGALGQDVITAELAADLDARPPGTSAADLGGW